MGLTASLAAALPPGLTRPPVVVNVAGRQVSIRWEASASTSSELAWGPTSQAFFSDYPNRVGGLPTTGRVHARTLRRLAPGTYFFRVRADTGAEATESAEGTFTVPPSEAFPAGAWSFDGRINTLVARPGALYLGGSFTRAWPTSGAALVVGPTGAPVTPHFPEVAGVVKAAAADGAGGFYVCGGFDYVGGLSRTGVVHLLADRGVDPDFEVQLEGDVNGCALDGGTLYLVGAFGAVNGQARNRAAAVDATTGATLPWNPSLNGVGNVVLVEGGRVYVGGAFTQVNGGLPRSRAAAFDSAGVATAFDPAPDGNVSALAASAGIVYLGGAFSLPRARLAAVDAVSGALAGGFDAAVVGTEVAALSVGNGQLFLGGTLTTVGGAARPWFASVDPLTGALNAYLPAFNGAVLAIAPEPGTNNLLVGGAFTTAGGSTRRGAAAVSLSTGLATSFDPDLSGVGNVVLPAGAGGGALVGGAFTGAGASVSASRYARLDLATLGLVSSPAFSGTVFAMDVLGDTLYAGGFFSTVGGQARANLAAIDLQGNTVTAWNPGANQSVHGLGVGRGGPVFVGGDFTQAGGAARAYAAALDADGGATAWAPQPNGPVEGLALGGDLVYLGGTFTTVGGMSRVRAAAVDLGGGLLPWSPSLNGTVYGFGLAPGRVFIGGAFSTASGQARARGAAYDLSGNLLPWDPGVNGTLYALLPLRDEVVVGGAFTSPRIALGWADFTTGAVQAANLALAGQPVRALATECSAGTPRFILGGSFLAVGPAVAGGLAVLEGTEVCAALSVDAGTDAGVDAGVDAGAGDAGAPQDAGTPDDAGVLEDAGVSEDAGVPEDAGVSEDAGVEHDAGVLDAGVEPSDGGPSGPGYYPVGCGCQGAPGFGLLAVALAWLRRRRG